MAFSIRSGRVEEKARAYAAQTGTTLTGALEKSLDVAIEREARDYKASALMAIYVKEPEREHFMDAIFRAAPALIAAPTAFEFLMVAHARRAKAGDAEPHAFLSRAGIRIEPWTERHVAIARDAFARFGKGQGHPAQLNFGDCMSYALAKALDAPLLYKGGDFALTDIRPALAT